jgi:hypothetical protein
VCSPRRYVLTPGGLTRPSRTAFFLPFVEKLAEAPPRAGFVTRERFDTIRKRLPDELRAAMTVAYTFGWNKREVLDLKNRLYNSQDGTLRLEPAQARGSTRAGLSIRASSLGYYLASR